MKAGDGEMKLLRAAANSAKIGARRPRFMLLNIDGEIVLNPLTPPGTATADAAARCTGEFRDIKRNVARQRHVGNRGKKAMRSRRQPERNKFRPAAYYLFGEIVSCHDENHRAGRHGFIIISFMAPSWRLPACRNSRLAAAGGEGRDERNAPARGSREIAGEKLFEAAIVARLLGSIKRRVAKKANIMRGSKKLGSSV